MKNVKNLGCSENNLSPMLYDSLHRLRERVGVRVLDTVFCYRHLLLLGGSISLAICNVCHLAKLAAAVLAPISPRTQPSHPLKRLKIIGDKQTIAITAANFLPPLATGD